MIKGHELLGMLPDQHHDALSRGCSADGGGFYLVYISAGWLWNSVIGAVPATCRVACRKHSLAPPVKDLELHAGYPAPVF